MPVPSVYVHFRPLMVLNYIFAQFTSRNVFGETSDSLEFAYSRVSLLSFMLQSLFNITNVIQWLSCKFKANTFIIAHHSFAVTLDVVVVGWLLVRSGNLIKSFKVIDRLRNTLTRFPVKVEQSSPSFFAWLTFLILVSFHIMFPPIHGYGVGVISIKQSVSVWLVGIVSASFTVCFFFRASMSLTSLFYSSSLVVQDLVRAWRQNRDVSGRPFQSPEIFCHLLMKFAHLFDGLQKTLSVHVLAVILYFNYGVLNDTFIHIYSEHPYFSSLVKLMSWCLYLGLLIVCVDLKSDQHERLSEEIFTSSVGHMSQREFMKFFSFAIDYFILCEQNLVFLRGLTGVAVVNSTHHC
ncbi:hypothetical protein J6590_054219 [Homalodisca vitripennis]|nr:hypothetical protein J6590_054219 [Homalodisca vitripennis]